MSAMAGQQHKSYSYVAKICTVRI